MLTPYVSNRFISLIVVVLVAGALLSACGMTTQGAPKPLVHEPALFLFQPGEEGKSEMYVKIAGQDAEKVTNDGQSGYFHASSDATKLLYVDADGALRLWEQGRESIKIDDGVQFGTVTFSAAEDKVYYLNEEGSLYVRSFASDDKTKLASDVYTFELPAADGMLYYLDNESQLYRVSAEGEREKLASDVSYYFTSNEEKGKVWYVNDENALYELSPEGEKTKWDDRDIEQIRLSPDERSVALLEEYNYDKLYGELYLLTRGKEEIVREKIASDVTEHDFSADGKSIYYLNQERTLYRYTFASQEREKLASDVGTFRFGPNQKLLAYVNEEKELFVREKDAFDKIATDVESFQPIGDETLYFVNADNEVYFKATGKEKTKLAYELSEAQLSYDNVYFVTTDKKAGVVKAGETEASILLENVDEYQDVFTNSYLLYEKLASLDDVDGYWRMDVETEQQYLSIEKTSEVKAILTMYEWQSEEAAEITVTNRTVDEIEVEPTDEPGNYGYFVVHGPDRITLRADGTDIPLVRATKSEVEEAKARTASENEQLLAVLDAQIAALNNEDLAGYMDTISPETDLYEETYDSTAYMFEYFDGIAYELVSAEIVERYEGEAVVEVVQTTRGVDETFTDNSMVARHTLEQMSDGSWKLTYTEVYDYEYLYE